ncbi:MAG: hypothetical protein AAF628_06820 [Planctomycetota bacterium]
MSRPQARGRKTQARVLRTEARALLRERWATLPPSAQTVTQLAGVAGVACGATHGVLERCNFACTSCYLTEIANRVPPLPYAEVCAQLDQLRAALGPGAKTQITAGEVTLLPLEELGRIVAYAVDIGLDPMVMSNGERFLHEPDYLLRLVRDYGLGKVCIHVDITQRGRPGLTAQTRERDLHPLRDRFADLIRRVRRESRKPLHASHTVTVTPANLADIGDVVDWVLRNADAFRMLSFQPIAEVGRTQDRRDEDVSAEALWERICAPVGRRLHRHAMHFGHPECNTTVPIVVVATGAERQVFDVVRGGASGDAKTFGRALRTLGCAMDLDLPLWRNALPVAGALVRDPVLCGRLVAYGVRRLVSDRTTWTRSLFSALRGRPPRVRPVLLVVHRFMTAAELATPLGQERLQACVFKVPVDGELVSMCELNASGLRRSLNQRALGQAQGRQISGRQISGRQIPGRQISGRATAG